MKTMLLLSEIPISLHRLETQFRALPDARVYFTSPARLAVERGADLTAIFVDDGILKDYDGAELERHGINPLHVHASAIELRQLGLLRDVLTAALPELGTAWLDNDAGLILPIEEAVRRLQSLEDVSQI